MKHVFTLLLTLAASAFGVEYTVSQDVTAASAVVTIQAPATAGRTVEIKSVSVGCATLVCTVVLERDGTAATATASTPVPVNAGAPASAAKGFSTSDVGTGSVLHRFIVQAGGPSVLRDLSGTFIQGSGTGKNFTVRVAGTSQQILVTIKFDEY